MSKGKNNQGNPKPGPSNIKTPVTEGKVKGNTLPTYQNPPPPPPKKPS